MQETNKTSTPNNEKNRPICGKLYRTIVENPINLPIEEGDIVMVTSEDHFLVIKDFPGRKDGVDTLTTLSLWAKLNIICKEEILELSGLPDEEWHKAFRLVE